MLVGMFAKKAALGAWSALPGLCFASSGAAPYPIALLQFEGGFAEQAGTAAGGHESQPRGLFGPEMLWVRPSANEGHPARRRGSRFETLTQC